jgi:hypothetical protein
MAPPAGWHNVATKAEAAGPNPQVQPVRLTGFREAR